MMRYVYAVFFCCLMSIANVHAGETEIRFSWWGGGERHEATLTSVRQFEAANPDIRVKAEYMGWNGYLERMTTQIGSGSEADLLQLNWAWLALFSKNGDGLVDLRTYADELHLDQFDEKWLESCIIGGKLNAIPASFTTRYFLWNKTTWDRAGLPLPKTWDDLLAAGPVFKEKLGPDYFPLDVELTSIGNLLASYIFQKTGKMIIDPASGEIGLETAELRDCIDFYRRLVESGAMTSLSHRASHTGDVETQTYEQNDYITGKWAGAYCWDSNITLMLSTPEKDFEFVLGAFPTQEGAKNSGRIGRPSQVFSISPNSRNPAAAARLLGYLLTSPESAVTLGMTRGVLLSRPSFAALKEHNLISPVNLEALDQIADTDVHTPSPYFEDPRMIKVLNDVLEQVSYGKLNADEATAEVERGFARILRRLSR
ncbi:MAG: ABC transporter substrate-binding protein [Planctomycetaceae bacterium]|nr:ABC transporter substrate-binding protein [Planctomycetaceae bacterium]